MVQIEQPIAFKKTERLSHRAPFAQHAHLCLGTGGCDDQRGEGRLTRVTVEAVGMLSELVVQILLVALGWVADGAAVAQRLSVVETATGQNLEGETTEDWPEHARWSSMIFVCPASKYSMSSSQTRHQRTRHPSVRRVDRAA